LESDLPWPKEGPFDARDRRFISRQPVAICKRPKGCITRLKRCRELGPLPRAAFCGDWLSNSTVGQTHWTGLQAVRELTGA
jgi:protoporphyrinogen/coproporphyrinogen III oxidase